MAASNDSDYFGRDEFLASIDRAIASMAGNR